MIEEGCADKNENPFWGVQWLCRDEKDRPICNFLPKVVRKITSEGATGITDFVVMKICFENFESSEMTVALSALHQVNWQALDPRCVFYPNCRKSKRYLEAKVRVQLAQAPTENCFAVEHLGLNRVAGLNFFVAGERVITCSSNSGDLPKLQLMNTRLRLDIDTKLTAAESFKGLKELMNLSPEIGRVLVAHAISGMLKSAFADAGFTPCTVLVIVGKSGMLKSHYVPQLVQLYNRGDEIKAVTRFNSSPRFIEEILSEYSECMAVIDDLHSAASRSIKRRNEATAEEIIRRISDDMGRGYKMGKSLVQEKFRGNAIFIGEYVFGEESTIPRALIAEITKRPDGKILDMYQRQQPLLVSTFYYFFLQWYVDHFDEICDEICKRLTTFRETIFDSEIHGRLCDTRFYLQISYMIFLEFCKESGFLSKEECQDEYNSFYSEVTKMIRKQQDRFENRGDAREVDYLKLIRKFYKHGMFCIAGGKEEYKPDKHDGIIYYDCLCLRGKCLERRLKKEGIYFNLEECVNYLLKHDALKCVGQKHTVQINGTGGKRFYAIKLDKLA
ncbi:MAG: hypothetical protein NC124_18640 [Clostridium sp.]|nr:hypothetical protein [Clostridium sp.]